MAKKEEQFWESGRNPVGRGLQEAATATELMLDRG